MDGWFLYHFALMHARSIEKIHSEHHMSLISCPLSWNKESCWLLATQGETKTTLPASRTQRLLTCRCLKPRLELEISFREGLSRVWNSESAFTKRNLNRFNKRNIQIKRSEGGKKALGISFHGWDRAHFNFILSLSEKSISLQFTALLLHCQEWIGTGTWVSLERH